MSSPSPHLEDELDCLVREALNAQVGSQEPPEYVWEQIRARLETDEPPPPRFLTVVLQSALTLLFVLIIGRGGLKGQLISGGAGRIPPFDLATSVATISVDQYSAVRPLASVSDESDVGSLKAFSKLRVARQGAAEPKRYPPGMVQLDVVPRPVSDVRHSPSPPLPSANWYLHDRRHEE